MKKNWFSGLLLAIFVLAIFPACNRGTGCPAAELAPKTNKKGEIKSKKGGKSSLFPKKMSKRM